jgi:hypothetical protein
MRLLGEVAAGEPGHRVAHSYDRDARDQLERRRKRVLIP